MEHKQVKTEEEFLKNYDINKYDRPSVSVDIVLFTVDEEEVGNYRKLSNQHFKVLLIKRGEHPFKDFISLPGGFVKINEDIEQTAMRELKEETGVSNIYLEQLYTFGSVDRDPRGRVISCAYMALVDSSKIMLKAGDDAKEVGWFEILYNSCEDNKYNLILKNNKETLNATIQNGDIIKSSGIAFDHAKIISFAIDRLRNKLEYTDIAFNLMPEYFTLTKLQNVYETILGKSEFKANFRRKIAGMVIETDEYAKNGGHRPSKLFKKNKNA